MLNSLSGMDNNIGFSSRLLLTKAAKNGAKKVFGPYCFKFRQALRAAFEADGSKRNVIKINWIDFGQSEETVHQGILPTIDTFKVHYRKGWGIIPRRATGSIPYNANFEGAVDAATKEPISLKAEHAIKAANVIARRILGVK